MPQHALATILRQVRLDRAVREMRGSDDGALLDRFVTRHDEAAFAALVQRHGGMVLGACRRVLRHAQDAEDACQATFLVLARKAGSIRRRESLASWLHGVAYRVSLRLRAGAGRRPGQDLGAVEAAQADTTAAVSWQEMLQVLDQELGRLPAHYRAPLVLCYLEGRTQDEAARRLGWPLGAFRGRLERGRAKLRERLTRRGIALPAVLAVLGVTSSVASAALPAALKGSLIAAAGLVAEGQATTGAVSARVAALTEGVIRTMFVAKVKSVAVLLAVVVALGTGLAGWGWLALAEAGNAEKEPAAAPPLVRSQQSGPWSAPATWEGGKVPGAGVRVQVRSGHTVTYDLKSDQVIRSIHVAGTLTFAPDKDTRLDVGLIKVQPGDDPSEDGFNCDAHMTELPAGQPRPALEVGTPDRPIDLGHTALVRLAYVDGLDRQSCPAIVCCGGRMDFHGAPLSRSWVKLGATAKKGDTTVTLAEPVTGWKVGDRIIITMTGIAPSSGYPHPGPDPKGTTTEERTIRAIDGGKLTLSAPLEYEHLGTGLYRGEVANLSRNVVVESADPRGERGHTMYHRNSAGAISYAEFRHLGKEGVLGRYALHYHLCGDTMRGSFVIGASIWDSANRWLAIHGTNYLIVRDNVGYRSKGHGFFLEDGTEVYNVLDRNLAVGARPAKPLPKQALAFDHNDGAGFWWANSLNTFTRNVAVENGVYGFRYEAMAPLVLPIQQPDGSSKKIDIRTLPFVRFADNEGHSQTGLYAAKMGTSGNKDGVGPDAKHPFIIRNLLVWNEHYAFDTRMPSVLMDGLRMHNTVYGYRAMNCDNHVYRNITLSGRANFPFGAVSAGPTPSKEPNHRIIHDGGGFVGGKLRLTVDGLTFEGIHGDPEQALINILDIEAVAKEAHFRNVKHDDRKGSQRGLLSVSPALSAVPKTPLDVMPVYLHDYYGPGRHAKLVWKYSRHYANDGLKYHEETPLTVKRFGPYSADHSVVAEVRDVEFPKLLDPVDDLPPTTVITHVRRLADGKVAVRGTTADNGTVKRVLVNGQEAKPAAPNFAEWEIALERLPRGTAKLSAHAEDAAGNVEKRPHVVAVGGSE
jgi:RNA polymerase sigma factor (sigma-70 family)